jgi:hypothetical protein
MFEGITPCSPVTRPLPLIAPDTHCEQMIWKVVLRQDVTSGTPTTYALRGAFGVPQQGTPGLAGGGTAFAMEGRWAIAHGTRIDRDAVVYRLDSDDAHPAVSFMKMSEDLLHVLNDDDSLMVGNAAWSYTLNRTDHRSPTPVAESPDPVPEAAPRSSIPPRPAVGLSVLGIFEGRLPCHPIVFELAMMTPYPGCAKLKSRLTLYQFQLTGTPGTYLYQGVGILHTGVWSRGRGTRGDPDAVVYQLHPHSFRPFVSFLKADENHLFLLDRDRNLLVGSALLSYTLSRTDTRAR